jgi:hypothetical protein
MRAIPGTYGDDDTKVRGGGTGGVSGRSGESIRVIVSAEELPLQLEIEEVHNA